VSAAKNDDRLIDDAQPALLTSARCSDRSVLFSDSLTPGTSTFSAAHFLGHCFGLIPAPGSFAAPAFPVPSEQHGSLHKAAARLGEQKPPAFDDEAHRRIICDPIPCIDGV